MNEIKSAAVRRASSEASLLFEWIHRLSRYYRLRETIPVDVWQRRTASRSA